MARIIPSRNGGLPTIVITHDDFTLVERDGSNPALSQFVYRYAQPDSLMIEGKLYTGPVQIIADVDPLDMTLAPDKPGTFLQYAIFQRGGIGSTVPSDPRMPDADYRWYSTGGNGERGGPVYDAETQNRHSAIALGPGDEAASRGPTEVSFHGFGAAYAGGKFATLTFNLDEDTLVSTFTDFSVGRTTFSDVSAAGRDADGRLFEYRIDRAMLTFESATNGFTSGARGWFDFDPAREADAFDLVVTAHNPAEARAELRETLMDSDSFGGLWG